LFTSTDAFDLSILRLRRRTPNIDQGMVKHHKMGIATLRTVSMLPPMRIEHCCQHDRQHHVLS
jgi:hypothetical protein